MVNKKKKIEELEGLRGWCSIAVIVSHVIYGTIQSANISSFPLFFVTSIGAFAHLAVLIFFVLSGFVIGYSNSQPFSKKNLVSYLTKRFIRIYPIYLLAVLMSFIALGDNFSLHLFLGNLLFLQTWLVATVSTNGPLWSLHFEIFFYLLFVVTWATKFDLNKSIFICIVFAFLAYYSLWLMGLWLARNYSNLPPLNEKILMDRRFWTPVAIVFVYGWANIYEPVISRFPGNKESFMPTLPSVLSDVIISGLVVGIIASVLGRKSPYYLLSFGLAVVGILLSLFYAGTKGLFGSMIHYQMALIFSVFILLSFLIKNAPYHVMVISAPLGTISYALYVVHEPIKLTLYRIFGVQSRPIDDLSSWMVNLLVIALAFFVAWLLEVYIQPIFSRTLKRYLLPA
jgi:peptidoglycan/LPS O-acetylase OafA/YrhL